MSDKYLIVGLGNPGRQYAKTRHNAGFWVVNALAQRYGLTNFTQERKALTADGIIQGRRVILAKPQTYMNLSGESVRALYDYYKVDINNIIVAYDDLDLDLGVLRLRKTGGHGGQNGVRNIIQHLGTKDFARVRFGIGRPPGKMKARDWVLQGLSGDDTILAEQVIETAADAIEKWLREGIDIAMSQFNGDVTESNNTPQKEDPRAALKLAERAHELNPKDQRPLEQMAKLYRRLGKVEKAVRAHLLLAELFAAQDDRRRMVSEWEQVVQLRPMMIDVREEIAIAYEEDDNTKKAVQTWLNLADYQMRNGELEAATASVQEALRLNPQHPKAQDLSDKLRDRLTT